MSTRSHRPLREPLAALLLALATAAFTLWQNTRIGVLWDLAYLLDSSFRIALGQVPYRDFPFAHAPLTFLIQAASIHLFGRVYWHVILYAALASAAATLLTWRIALRLMPTRWLLATLLCLTLVPLGIYSIYPHPIYDSDCILSVLLALWLLLRAGQSVPRNLLAGATCVLPLFFKQNIGLLFLLCTLACMGLIALSRLRSRERPVGELAFFTGAVTTLAAALITLHLTVGLHNYLYWTITFAAQRRLPGLSLILGIYHQPSLLWTIPTSLAALFLLHLATIRYHEVGNPGLQPRVSSGLMASKKDEYPRLQLRVLQIIAFALLIAPFLYATITFFLADDASGRTDALLSLWPHLLILSALFALVQLRPRSGYSPTITTLLPLILLATIHGTFLSQQLWGSTYALWPLLILLLVLMLSKLPSLATSLTFTITAVFLLCGTIYALSLDRLSYNHLEGPLAHATLPSLRGLTTPGPYIPAFEQLIRTTDTLIPPNDGILLLPGQDPFYFATGRTPQFPVLLLDPATNPYSPMQLALEATRRNIRWLIIDKDLQLTADPIGNLSDYVITLRSLGFRPVQTLDNYTIYQLTP